MKDLRKLLFAFLLVFAVSTGANALDWDIDTSSGTDSEPEIDGSEWLDDSSTDSGLTSDSDTTSTTSDSDTDWNTGDADNNDDGSSDSSTDDGSSGSDTNYDSGNADNNDDGTSSGDADNNDDGTSSGDADNNDDGTSSGDADNNDDGTSSSDSDNNDDSTTGETTDDGGTDDGTDDGTGDGTDGGTDDGGGEDDTDQPDDGDDTDGEQNSEPTVDFTFSPTNPRVNQEVTFEATATDEDGTIESIQWDLDDDMQYDDASGEVVKRSFSSSGDYKISVRATDDDGAKNMISDTVTVEERRSGGGGDDDDDDAGGGGGGSGGGSIDDGDVVVGGPSGPQPSMTASLSSNNVDFGETVTVNGRFENVDSPRDVEVFFSGERIDNLRSASSFSTSFEADKVGTNTVRVVSGDLQRNMQLQVNPTVNIESINSRTFLRAGERHEVCVELEGASMASVTLYQDGESQGTKRVSEVACFIQFAPEDSDTVDYKAVARAGTSEDVEEKTISVLQPGEPAPTGGFFSKPSNIALTGAAILAAILSAIGYKRKAEISAFLSGL